MPSKLGPHILKETESVQQMIRAGCRIVKFMGGFDLLPEVTDPAVTLIGRYPASFTAEEQRAKERPEEAARRFIDSQREFYARHPAIKLWEGHNEPMWI